MRWREWQHPSPRQKINEMAALLIRHLPNKVSELAFRGFHPSTSRLHEREQYENVRRCPVTQRHFLCGIDSLHPQLGERRQPAERVPAWQD